MILLIWQPAVQDESEATRLWVTGFDVSGMTDDAGFVDVSLPIVKTKQYETRLGTTATVLSARPFKGSTSRLSPTGRSGSQWSLSKVPASPNVSQ